MIDFSPLRRGEATLGDLAGGLDRAGLAAATDAMVNLQLSILAGAEDADTRFVPDDPGADDPYAADPADRALAWTLGHLVGHVTASSEEAAARSLLLARGLPIEGRSRHEVPWQELDSVAACRDRLLESRRMRLAMLDAWPDRPHLDNLWQPRPERPGWNAVAVFASGLLHDDGHLAQMRSVLAGARAARGAG